MKELIQKTKEYLLYIEEHYENVQKAWNIIKENKGFCHFPTMYDDFKYHSLRREVELHDMSKLSIDEFQPYRAKFFPTDFEKNDKAEQEKIKRGFDNAWAHHKENNDHHWQNWTEKDHILIEGCLFHNIIDWMAMGMKFNDTAESYYNTNKDTIILPEWAETELKEIFNILRN